MENKCTEIHRGKQSTLLVPYTATQIRPHIFIRKHLELAADRFKCAYNLLVYKTAVNTLVKGAITHQKPQI